MVRDNWQFIFEKAACFNALRHGWKVLVCRLTLVIWRAPGVTSESDVDPMSKSDKHCRGGVDTAA